ncbi:MAG: hypothetical protein OEY55_02550 [Acidimicrobiia bacterium]|nr:hypothetical protein [Acidimicrobiia bacterium]MDH5420668.1 hypothetical protein [Acidimicrobiia bacterium]MDH5505141.1 hypothetical protein [Acidimicrobiia bacterium]
MTDANIDQAARDAADSAESASLSKALRVGFVIGTPVTFAVFFVMIYFIGDVELVPALVTALWVAIVGGGFYGGITGLLTVLNKHGH